MIIAVASEKGGTGKTTIATNLAIIRAKDAADVLLIDGDPQGSSRDFVAVRETLGHAPDISSVCLYGAGITAEVRKLRNKFDDIVIDVGGRDSITMRSALLVAEVLVLPFLPSQFDAWSLERMDDLIGEALSMNEILRTVVFLNNVDSNPKISLSNEALTFAKNLKNIKFSGLKVGYRVAFRRSVADGQSVTEIDKKDPKANQEIMALYKEVFK